MTDNTQTSDMDVIEIKRRHLLVSQMLSTAIVSIIAAVVLLLVLNGEAEQQLLNIWFGLMVSINLVRLVLTNRYKYTGSSQKQQYLYYRLLILLTASVGCTWGVGGTLFLQQVSLPYQVFITLVVAGMTAGAVASYTASITAYTVFSLPSAVPIGIWLLLQENRVQLAMGTMVLVFTTAMWMSTRRYHKMLIDSLVLQAEKESLIRQLEHRSQTIEDAHNALLASEEKYEDLYDNAPDMYLSVDVENTTVLQCNQTLVDRLGYTGGKDEIIGKSIFDIYHPDCYDDVAGACHTFVATGEVCNAELKLRCKDGSAIDVMLNASAVRDEGGKVLSSHSNLRDITERKARDLFETEQQKILKKILDTKIPLCEILEDVVLAIQHQAPAMTGSILLLDEDGKHLLHGAAPDLPADYCKAVDGGAIGPTAGSCGTAAYRKERVVVTDISSDPLWADYTQLADMHNLAACWSQPIKDADGHVLGTFAMYYHHSRSPDARDIRLIEQAAALAANVIKRRKEEQELSRLAEILQATSDFVGMSDTHGRTIFINRAGKVLMGYGEDEDLSGLTIADYHSPEVSQQMLQEVLPELEKSGTWRGQTTFLSKHGKEIITDQLLISHRDENGVVTRYSTIARDITAQIKAEQERATLQSQVEHAQRLDSLGVLAGGIAHDFNNILTAILGNAALAEHKVLADPEGSMKYLTNIIASSERAAELCKQMLAYSGKGKFVVEVLNLSVMVEEITRLLEVSLAKNITLEYHLMENLPSVEADAAQMQQVIMNLVMNASDAISDKKGSISIATGLIDADRESLASSWLDDELPPGSYVYLEVSDTGCGMDKDIQKKIFEPFFTTKFTGHGLGMSAVLGIVRGHHGAIKVHSTPGQGTTFKVLLPVCDQSVLETTSPTDSDLWQGSGTILVVDDEESIREIASVMLENMGFTTLTAIDGKEAVRIYSEHQNEITAVLLDMTMPNMDGNTCFIELQKINRNVTVVLSSGYNELEATSRFASQGLAGFIQKPYLPETLQSKMQEILQGS